MPWDIEHGAEHRELLGMLHVKRGDYAHWAVRIDRAARRVTHLSAGPVVKARDYRNEARCHRSADLAKSRRGDLWPHAAIGSVLALLPSCLAPYLASCPWQRAL